ncbi:MAG TPA: hypothetical protein VH062_25305 [Polyangiaceae bacterium]|jgi:hypothetical protein|nr:hypothetical protein [Polyangiaceae bacterium]
MWLCDPHGEMVVGTGASTPEHVQALCSVDRTGVRLALAPTG